MSFELLSPETQVPEAVRFPKVRELTWFDHDMSYQVELGDGSRWRFTDCDRLFFNRHPVVGGELVQQLFDLRLMRYDGRRQQGRSS